MSPEERIYLNQRFNSLHEEIHKIAIDVAEIKQWKLDQDKFEEVESKENRYIWEKTFGILGTIGMAIALIVTFI